MRDKLSRLSVYVRDVRDVRDVFLFHNIYIYGRKIPMKSGIFARGGWRADEGRRMSDKIRQKERDLRRGVEQ